jgi:hypothetical protein
VTVVLAAIVAGIGIGLISGGRLRNLGQHRLRSLWVLVIGAGLQVVSGRVDTGGSVLVLASYAFLAAFAIRNLARVGMGVMVVGVVLNAAPIALDGGMPVEAHAIVSARIAPASEIDTIDFGSKRHLARRGDHLRGIDDTIPNWYTHEVLSIGDLVIAVGVAAVVAGLLHPGYRAVNQRS